MKWLGHTPARDADAWEEEHGAMQIGQGLELQLLAATSSSPSADGELKWQPGLAS